MNKNLYRIVFNKARGILMVVAENISAQGKGDADPVASIIVKQATNSHCMQMKQISFAAKLAVGIMTLVMPLANAQIVADPNAPGNQRPTVLGTANGLPQVNIQTPSAAGVSRNTYSQFDVQSNGAILNNSRTNVQTQTGGWVQGNPWLVGGAARVILNEVNSSNPSQIRGYVEVAGQRAEVIIANPAGIQVNGGGFINANRVTLTTGTAVLNGGSLDSYRIPKGTISIDGLGLDTRTADYTDILARSVQVNAGIWANRLKVVTGANEVSTTSTDYPGNVSQGVTPIAGSGPTPQFSLDVAAIGGMYAGHIYLVGSESGLGVRNKGVINAAGGNLVLLSNGLLTNEGSIQAASSNGSGGNVRIDTAGIISNIGATAIISAQSQATIATATDLVNAAGAKVGATSSLAVSAGSINNAGKLTAGGTITVTAADVGNAATGEIAGNTTKITATNSLTNRGLIDGSGVLVQAGTLDNIGTGRIYGDDLGIAANVVNNDSETINGVRSDAVIAARQRLDIGAGIVNNRNGALLFSAGMGAEALNIGGSLDAQGHATGTADTINNAAATIESLGGINISAQQINNLNPDFSTRTDTKFNAAYAHYIGFGSVRYLESETGMSRLEYAVPSSVYPFAAGYSRVGYQQIPEYDPEQDMYVNTYPDASNVWTLFNVPVGEHQTLASRLMAYNQDLRSRASRVFDHIWITGQQIVETVVDNAGTPGQIVAGGGITLTGGNILNDNSKILAGGNLDISGGSLINTETPGHREVTDIGTFRRDFVEYSPYRLRAGEFGSGSYVFVSASVTTKLDTSLVQDKQSVSGTGTQLTARTAPTSSLLILNPDANDSHIYKGDPRFNNQRQWLSSDYMLQVLSTDPNTIQKRLGDGFYEQKLIREQVAQLTGRRFLDGYASDEAQYQALMQSGVTYAQKWNLVPGIALTASQVAQLTSDMVWLVAQAVVLPDGTKTIALVPQLYAMPKSGDLAANGSLLAGQNVNIQLTGDLKNSGTIGGRNVTQLNASNIQNLGTIAGKAVNVDAQQDLNNLGGRIIAEDVLLATAGRDLTVQSTTSTGSVSVGRSSSSLTQVDRVAGLYVTGSAGILVASAGRDFSVLAGVLSSAGDIQATAGNNVNLGTVDTGYKSDLTANERNYMRQSGTQEVGSLIVSGGSTILAAGNDIHARAVTVNATENLAVGAGGNIQIVEGRATTQSDDARYAKSSGFLSKSSTESRDQSQSDIAISSNFSGNTLNLSAGKNLSVTGSNVVAINDVNVSAATGDIKIASTHESYSEQHASKESKSGFTSSFSSGVASVGVGKSSSASQSSLNEINQHASSVASTSGNVHVQAGKKLTVTASDIGAGKDVTLIGSSVDLSAAQNTRVEHDAQQSSSSGFSVGVTVNPLAAFKSAYKDSGKNNKTTSTVGKTLKRDEGIADGAMAATTAVVVQAGSRSANSTQDYASSTAQVSTLNAGGALTILATNGSVTSQGASMSAERDALIVAQNNINLDVAHNLESKSQTNSAKGWSLDNRGSLPVGVFNNKGNGNGSTDTITGSSLSVGGKAALATTTGDINLTGSNVVATGDTSINAAKNLIIRSGQNTVYNDNHSNNKAIGKVVISDTERFAGYHNEKHNDTKDGITQVDANVASLQGNVNLSAGNNYTQITSNILAGNDVNLTAKAIDITTAANTGTSAQENSDLKIGMFARVSSPIIDLVNNIEAAQKSDGRLQAMQGMAAAANAYQAASAVTGGSGSIIKGEVGVGFASAKSRDASDYSQAQGSTITGGNNVSLTSTEGDIKATGSSITADKTLTLNSAKDILLDAGQSTAHSVGNNRSAGLEVGVGYSIGAQTGVYAYVAANVGRGDYNNDATINSNTHLSGDTITLKSQGDTTLKGADVKADTINADIKGKLAIESVQDIATQHNQQSNAGVRIQVSIGTAWEASGNASQSKANGSSSTVNEQSGLFAGDGGYHVNADTIALKGAAIASSNAAKSELTANAITFQNIDNKMDYKASSMSVSGSVGGASKNADSTSTSKGIQSQTMGGASNPNLTPGIVLQDKGSDSSITYATLTDGKINIGGNSVSSAKDLGAHTDLASANTAIAALPDLKNVMKNQQAMAAAANTVIAVGTQIANDRASSANKKIDQANKDIKAAQIIINDPNAGAEQIIQAQQDLATAQTKSGEAQQTAKDWGPTGDYTRALKVVTGVLVGGTVGQGVTQIAANASAPYVANAIGDYFAQPEHANETAQLLSHAVLGAVLAASNGGNVTAGASAGAAGELAAQVISRELYPKAYDADGSFHPEKLNAQETNTVIALSTAVGALVGGTTGGSLLNASIGGAIAANAATNNYLKATDLRSKEQKIKWFQEQGSAECEIKILKEYERKNAKNTAEINYSSVMTEVVLKDEKQKLEQLLLDPSVSAATKVEARKSIQQLDVAINTIQKAPSVQVLGELGMLVIDAYTLGELAVAKALTSTIVKTFVANKIGTVLSDEAATRLALNFYADGGYDLAPAMYKAAAQNSTKNPQAGEVILGKHIEGSPLSYEVIATNRGATYFEMKDWVKTQDIIGADNVWNINKEFLDQQMSQGKIFIFTANPELAAAKTFTRLEYQYLTDNGYMLSKINGEYRAIKR